MKLRNIFFSGLFLMTLASCNDYLDVDAPSKYTNEYIFSNTVEANRALNGVYAKLLVNNTYGKAFISDLLLNSDVDFTANSNENSQDNTPRRFDVSTDASTVKSVWNACYETLEAANNFIYNLENSDLNKKDNADYENAQQMLGEAKVIRAMIVNELCDYWGDVPFTMEPTFNTNNFTPDVVDRTTIRKQLIDDLKAIAPNMKFSSTLSEGIERVSKEACWAMIARLALSAGGYSLRPVEGNSTSYGEMKRPDNYREFYATARAYADSVIKSGTHALVNSYDQVFVDECNYKIALGDDVIFEIPFAKNNTGNMGYYQGPTAASSGGNTQHQWGECNGGVRTEAFYRYTFDEKDLRRDFVNGMWYYPYTQVPTMRSDYSVHNNKWSKLWTEAGNGLGVASTGSTGINYPYLRYADVLLMFAEADNELGDGPSAEAKNALKQVRQRAFSAEDYAEKVSAYVDEVSASKASFLDAVLNERKWEFAGENLRWKDLVRNNKYAEVLYYTFLRYNAIAINGGGSCDFLSVVEQHDKIDYQGKIPYEIYSFLVKNPNDGKYPNSTLYTRYVYNPDSSAICPNVSPAIYVDADHANLPYVPVSEQTITGNASDSKTIGWTTTAMYNWLNDTDPKPQVLFSLYGFIRGNEDGSIYYLVRDGKPVVFDPMSFNVAELPVVRYILPYPEDIISRSQGKYKNSYGY